MKKVNVYLKIENPDSPYEYRGIAYSSNEIIEFNDNSYNYVFDNKIKRVTKSNKDESLILDFLNKKLMIKNKSLNFSSKIEVLEIEINNLQTKYTYKLDGKKICIKLNKEV